MASEINFPPQDEMPGSVDEAVAYLAETLPAETIDRLKDFEEKDLIQTHFGLGGYVRNHLSLWNPESRIMKEAKERFGVTHEDDASMQIIRLLWEKLRAE
jgi:hypothetical protein